MKYYITTPIYYVNAAPHIGHAYTTMVADTVKRFKQMQGFDAALTTGSDEHGVNVEAHLPVALAVRAVRDEVLIGELRRIVLRPDAAG